MRFRADVGSCMCVGLFKRLSVGQGGDLLRAFSKAKRYSVIFMIQFQGIEISLKN